MRHVLPLLPLGRRLSAQKAAGVFGAMGGVPRPFTLDFVNNTATLNGTPTTIAALTTFSRSGIGLASSAAGVYSQFADGVLRRTDRGVLIEGSRTNICRNNRRLDLATWTKSNITASANQVGVDGVSNAASSITATANNGTCTTTCTGSGNRSYSAFVKRLTGTGTVDFTNDNGSTWHDITAQIGADWSQQLFLIASSSNPTIGFRLGTSGDAIAVDFVHAENGAAGMSSPIATTGTVMTRNAETFGLANLSLVDLAKGTLLVEFETPTETSAVGMLVCVRTNTPTVVIEAYTGSTPPGTVNDIRAATVSGMVMDGSTPYTPADGLVHRAAFAWTDGDNAAAYSADLGGNLVTSTANVLDMDRGAITFIGIGNNSGGQQFYGYIRRVEYIPERLSDAELQEYVFMADDQRLRWAPPAQDNPTTITLPTGFWQATSTSWTNTSGNGKANGPRAFDDDEDVVFTMPGSARTGDFEASGGRNIRIIGGAFGAGRATFKDVCGSLFLEGCSWALTASKDAINFYSKTGYEADWYFQNLVISGVRGSNAGTHADIIQPTGPVGGRICIDRLTGDSNYQGLTVMEQSTVAPIAGAAISRVNLSYNAVAGDPVTYLIYLRDTDQTGGNGTTHYATRFYGETVWLAPRDGQTIAADGVYPAAGTTIDGVDVGAIADGDGNVAWPAITLITGQVMTGAPPGGDYATAGLGYTSPGYQLSAG